MFCSRFSSNFLTSVLCRLPCRNLSHAENKFSGSTILSNNFLYILMNEIDIPIIQKSNDLYKMFHEYRKLISKNDRHTIFERTDNLIIDTIQCFLEAGYANPANKLLVLERASVNLNMIRFFIRLMKEIRTIDNKKYVALQLLIDEIGRMLGGWIRSKKTPPPPGIDK